MLLLLVVVGARLVDIQVLHSAQYRQQAAAELTRTVTVPALRGGIYDRNGRALVTSVPTKTVIADCFQISHPKKEAASLAPLLGVPATTLAPLLAEHSGYVPLVHHLSLAQAAKVTALQFPGITMIDGSVRVDAAGNLASPVIGAVNASGAGDAGLEYEYNRVLAGHAGSETVLESPAGVQLPGTPVTHEKAAAAGTGLELTLDEPLQYTVAQDLAAEVASSHAKSGEAVVMDVRTGQVLAMVNLVAGATGGAPTDAPDNLATDEVYEPGSVFKVVTFSAALADGVITPSTTFTVPDQIVLDGSVFHDAEVHPTEQMTATQIIAQSSNIGTSEIAQRLGETRLLAQVRKLGFGKPTGLNFPGDSPGLVVGASQWEPTDFVSLPIGQVDAVSALQVLDAYNAVANGGVLVTPSLVRAKVSAGGAVAPVPAPATTRVMSASTAATLTGMLEQVVTAGTGIAAVVPGYKVAGKTGTSQIPAPGGAGYIPGAFMGTFVGFAPASHPVLSTIVVLNRPTPIYGGAVAAPVFAQIMGYALHHYDIPTTPGAPAAPTAAAATPASLAKAAA